VILTFDQIHKYFELRLDRSLPTRDKIAVRCPFHSDGTASATVFLSGNGGFNCQGCSAKGNTFQFEMLFSKCSMSEAKAKIAEITGAKVDHAGNRGPCTAVYDYRKTDGSVAFQKRRYESPEGGKTFVIYHPSDSGAWASGIGNDTKKIPYNLPSLITCNVALIAEGEKDCGTLESLNLFASVGADVRVAVTTNFEGAWQPSHSPKWLDSYTPYFSGKHVFIFEDNDESGRTWADYVTRQIYPYAESVRRVYFPDLPEKGDVTDWMENHTAGDLEKRLKTVPRWEPPKIEIPPMSQDAVNFATEDTKPVEWIIQNIIPTAGNGIICGDPKSSKSYHAMDVAISLACGEDWLNNMVIRRVKTYLVSREDAPGITQRRIGRLLRGNPVYMRNLEGWMRVNTRRHTADFKVTNPDHMNRLIDEIGKFGSELCILDVFRSVHESEENDNDEMPNVLAKVNRIQNECNCAVMLVHHLSKSSPDNIFKGLRGASAIHGWMEWGIGISVTNPEEEDKHKWIRKLEFENKEGVCSPVFTKISGIDPEIIRIERVESPNSTATASRPTIAKQKKDATAQTQSRMPYNND
jgi:hypothetical protein